METAPPREQAQVALAELDRPAPEHHRVRARWSAARAARARRRRRSAERRARSVRGSRRYGVSGCVAGPAGRGRSVGPVRGRRRLRSFLCGRRLGARPAARRRRRRRRLGRLLLGRGEGRRRVVVLLGRRERGRRLLLFDGRGGGGGASSSSTGAGRRGALRFARFLGVGGGGAV